MKQKFLVIEPPNLFDAPQSLLIIKEFEEGNPEGRLNVLIDCSKVAFIDSAGLGCIVRLMKATQKSKQAFGICSINEQAQLLLTLTSLDQVIKVYRDRDEFMSANS